MAPSNVEPDQEPTQATQDDATSTPSVEEVDASTSSKKKTTKKKTTKKTTGSKKKTTKKTTSSKKKTSKKTTKTTAADAPTEEDAPDTGSEPIAVEAEDDSGDAEATVDVEAEEKKKKKKSTRKADSRDADTGDEEVEDKTANSKKTAKTGAKKTRSRRGRPERAAIEVTPTGPQSEPGSRLMLVDEVPGESCRIAITERGRLEELFVERAQNSTAVGNIYKARVINIESAIQAAFVDYGQGMNGFLHVSDLHPRYFPGADKVEKVGRKTPRRDRPPIQDALKKGQEILVQVLKQGVGTKGPTVTSYLSIPGRLMVMMPGMDRVGVSRKVDDEQRESMRKILDTLDLPDGFGFILRTAGYNKTKTELKRDVSYLKRLWEQLEKRMSKVGAPSELYTEGDLIVRTIRDVVDESIGSIIVNSGSGFERASNFLKVIAPKSGPVVRHYREPVPLFEAFGIEQQIELIHAREVPLKSGGALVIDQTEAMVAIDVNSGRSRGARDAESNAVSTNREAVDEIARQLRLRDQGGLVVCDLIDMRFARNREEIEKRLAKNLSADRARTTFLPISEFGLVEMTRQRIRPSIRSQYFSTCGLCHGIGEIRNADSVAADAIRKATRYLAVDKVARVELACGFRVASAILANHRRRIDALERERDAKIDVRISDQIPGDRFDVYLYDERGSDLSIGSMPKPKAPDPESLPTEILDPEEEEIVETGGGRRRRRRRKPPPADVVSIALAGGFEDDEDDDDEASESTTADGDQNEGSGGGRKRRRRRRRRGRGGGESKAPEVTEPVRVHALAKELAVKSREVLDKVAEQITDLDLKGHMSWIPAEHVLAVKAIFAPPPAETEDESTTEDAASAETGNVAVGEETGDDRPKKKRRRRRRGGRKHRRREGGDGDGDSPETETGTEDGHDAGSGPDETDSTSVETEPVASGLATDSEGDTADAATRDDTPSEPEPSTETSAAKPRRSLYGGRFQRTGVPTPVEDR